MAASPPPSRIRLVGRALNNVASRAPALWPLVRRPMRRYFDDFAEGWDERTGAFSAEYLAPLGAALLRVEPEPERALDVGTGTGAGALLVAREYPRARVRGVDLSEEMIRKAQARIGLDPEGRVAFKVADASDLPYDDAYFDLITLVNVPPFFGELARVLRPGGSVVVVATSGDATPFYTPDSVLRRGFERKGLEHVESGSVDRGTWFVARLPA